MLKETFSDSSCTIQAYVSGAHAVRIYCVSIRLFTPGYNLHFSVGGVGGGGGGAWPGLELESGNPIPLSGH